MSCMNQRKGSIESIDMDEIDSILKQDDRYEESTITFCYIKKPCSVHPSLT